MPPIDEKNRRDGVVAAVAAYVVWGFFPILFHLLDGVDPFLIVAHRIVWSLIVVGAILFFTARLDEIRAAFSDRGTITRLFISSVLVALNWLIYVWAVLNNRVLETSFGYFLNPLVNVALGMILLGERQTPMQWVAFGIAGVAMALQAIGLNGIPWIALGLAVSFAFYGYFRKTVRAGSATGLFVETTLLVPFAMGYIVWSIVATGVGAHGQPDKLLFLIFTGPATSLTLMLFAYGVQRLRLTTIGIIQYIAPSIQFVLAVTFFGEELNTMRLLSFALIWVSLVIFTWDGIRSQRAAVPEPQA
jgi:chloramphenicol-sensitive protein RarD